MKRYKQLTYEQRCQIEVLKKRGDSQTAIAETVGVNQSSVSRELRRNTGQRGYRHKQAQRRATTRRQGAYKAIKMTPDVITLVDQQVALKWSPEQISGWLKKEHHISLSHERIYQHIWQNKARGGDLYQQLRRHGRRYHKRCNGKTSRGQIKNRISIDERPEVVDERSRVGDWEIDTVIGKGQSGALVTIVERATRFTVSAQVDSKHAAVVTDAVITLLTPYTGAVHTITADNGKEFAYHEQITAALGAPVYFAHPYHSWERGLNENTNGLLRQYWPKETNFKQVTDDEVESVVEELNNRPRKVLAFYTPAELMENHMAAIAA